MKKVIIETLVDDNFEVGCCHECPFSYEQEYMLDEYYSDWDDYCVIGWNFDECQLVVKENANDKEFKPKG